MEKMGTHQRWQAILYNMSLSTLSAGQAWNFSQVKTHPPIVPISLMTNGFSSLGIATPCSGSILIDADQKKGPDSFLLHANIIRYYAYVAQDENPTDKTTGTPQKLFEKLSLSKDSNELKPSQSNTRKDSQSKSVKGSKSFTVPTIEALEGHEEQLMKRALEIHFHDVIGLHFPQSLIV
eukprot:Lithocolla_globosa_v1_NODE_3123_length_1759_cov_28.126761.p1 type:complete len:179 gc:universal NODE_3123_length_1759_cov_28.126761:881-345(-)